MPSYTFPRYDGQIAGDPDPTKAARAFCEHISEFKRADALRLYVARPELQDFVDAIIKCAIGDALLDTIRIAYRERMKELSNA